MVARLNWSTRALSELDEIVEYVSRDVPSYGKKIAKRAFARSDTLSDLPGQGRRLRDYVGDREIREVFVHRWRLIYEVTGDGIVILAIIHGARLLENTEPL